MCKLVILCLILVTTLMPATTSPKQPVLCPLQCVCHLRQDRHVIDCSHKNLTSLPFLCNFENDRSGKKVVFYANGNKFRYILKSAFYHVRNRLSHLEIASNAFNIELAYSTFNSFADSLEILKLEPVYENLNTLINSLENLKNMKVLQLTSVTNSFQILSQKFSHPNLTDLSLQKCRIRNISSGVFQNINELRVLNLSFNHLADFPQELVDVVSKSVFVLKLSNNEISEINDGDIAKGCKLAFLDLSFNAINFIEEGVLEKCGRLRFLNLSHNPNLVSMGRFVFDGLVGLNLDVSHSPISSLDFVKPGAVARVLAFGTELECSCDLQVKHMEALHGNLKGTCRLRLDAVNIQSKILNCAQNEQRQKRVRLNDWGIGGENGLDKDTKIDTVPNQADTDPSQADTDTNQADDDSRLIVQTELKPSTWDPYLANSQETTQRGCKIKPCMNFESFTNKDEGILDHMSVADSSKAEETREETIEISENTFRPGPSTSLDSVFDISSTSVNSESITPSPIRTNHVRPETSISFQVPAMESFEMTASLNLPDGDTLSSTAEGETDALTLKISNSPHQEPSIIDASSDVVDSTITLPFKPVLLSTSMLDISLMAPESTSASTPDITSAQSDISSATHEMPLGASEHHSFKAYVNIEELSMQKSQASIYSCTDVSCTETTQMTMPPKQAPVPCGDHDHTIQPSTTITIVNSIYSTITYIRDYTYYIKTVNNLNPQFLPPTKTRDYVITESPAKDTQNTQSDAPSAPNAEVEEDTGNDVKAVSNESDQQSELDAEGVKKDGNGDENTDEDGGYFFPGPVYLLACFVHAWLLFAAFLKLEPGVKIKK